MTQVLLARWVFLVLRRLLSGRSRRVVYLLAIDVADRALRFSWPLRNPARWWRWRAIAWQVRRGTWGIRV